MPTLAQTRPSPHQLASWLALYPGLYAAAALTRFHELSSPAAPTRLNLAALAFVALTTTPTYLLDRVKLHNHLLDPADQAAEPERYHFLLQYLTPIRLLCLFLFLTAALVGRRIHPLAPLAVVLSIAGVVIYAPGPKKQRPRPKDLYLVKNIYTAAGLTSFVVITALVTDPNLHPRPAITAAVIIFLRMILDALFSDIDDAHSDSQFGTQTQATRQGSAQARNLALTAQFLLIIIAAAATPFPTRPRLIWAATSLASWLTLLITHPRRLKDYIDLRLPAEALTATLLLTIT